MRRKKLGRFPARILLVENSGLMCFVFRSLNFASVSDLELERRAKRPIDLAAVLMGIINRSLRSPF